MSNYSVVRLDDLKSRHVGRNYSVRVPVGKTLENGNVAKVLKREVDNLDVHTIEEATAGDSVILIAEVALVYDNNRIGTGLEKNFIMKEGEVVRGYELAVHDLVSVSLEGFVTEPAEGDIIVPNGFKLDKGSAPATGTYFEVVKIEQVGGWLTIGTNQTPTKYAIMEVKQV